MIKNEKIIAFIDDKVRKEGFIDKTFTLIIIQCF